MLSSRKEVDTECNGIMLNATIKNNMVSSQPLKNRKRLVGNIQNVYFKKT